jgi:hypothetical protein
VSAALVTCPSCNGEKLVDNVPCDECNGLGRVVPTAAADCLIHDILGPEVGSRGAEAVLKALRTHRTELVDWLVESGIVARTKFGLVRVRDHDGHGNAWESEPLVSVIPADADGAQRLWLVQT